MRWIGFGIAGARLLLPATHVVEVMHTPPATEVPGTKSWLRGVACVHGRLLSLVDLEQFLGGEGAPRSVATPMLLVEQGELLVGLLVDEIYGVQPVPAEIREGAPPSVGDWLRPWVAAHLLLDGVEWGIFDLPAVLEDAEFMQAAA